MRSSLMGSLVANLRFNLARKVDRVRVFEAARCFLRLSGGEDPRDPARALAGYHQPLRIGGFSYRPAAASPRAVPLRPSAFFGTSGDGTPLPSPCVARLAPLPHSGASPGRR